MKRSYDESELRKALEKDYPVPKKLLPENIDTLLTENRVRSHEKHYGTFTRFVSIAACAAFLTVGIFATLSITASMIHQKKNFSPADSISSPDDEGKSEYASPLTNSPTPVLTNDEVYDILTKLQTDYNEQPAINEDSAENSELSTADAEDAHISQLCGYAEDWKTNGVTAPEKLIAAGDKIYYSSGSCVYIINEGAAGSDEYKPYVIELSDLSETVTEPQLYITDNFLHVVYSASGNTAVNSYDISSDTPKLFSCYEQSGEYTDSRMVGNKICLVTTEDFANRDLSKTSDEHIPYYILNSATGTKQSIDVTRSDCSEVPAITVFSEFDTHAAPTDVYAHAIVGRKYNMYCSENAQYLYANTASGECEIVKFYVSGDHTEESMTSMFCNGIIQDKYCIDDYNGDLRILISRYEKGSKVKYLEIFDSNLTPLDDYIGFNENEIIRFDGEKAYAANVEKDQPMYVIDLSDPKPEICEQIYIEKQTGHLTPFKENRYISLAASQDDKSKFTLTISEKHQDGSYDYLPTVLNGHLYPGSSDQTGYIMTDPDNSIIGFPLYENGNSGYMLFEVTDDALIDEALHFISQIDFEADTQNGYPEMCRGVCLDNYLYVFCGRQLKIVDVPSGMLVSSTVL